MQNSTKIITSTLDETLVKNRASRSLSVKFILGALMSLGVMLPQVSQAQVPSIFPDHGGADPECHPATWSGFIANLGIKHYGGYVADFEVYANGKLIQRSGSILVRQCFFPTVPDGMRVQDLTIKGFVHTGLVWNPRVHFMTANGNTTKWSIIYGTTLDARAVAANYQQNPVDVTVR